MLVYVLTFFRSNLFNNYKNMEATIKKLVWAISHKSTREIIKDYTKELTVDNEKKIVTIIVDRKYALNELFTSEHIGHLNAWVKKCFGEEYEPVLKNTFHAMKWEKEEHHNREMNIPHNIHL